MKRDIRALFKGEDLVSKTLPKHHREDFLKKLKENKAEKIIPKKQYMVYKVAASILLFTSLSYFINKAFNTESRLETSQIVEQIETVERQYLIEIDKEWNSFLALTNDKKLVSRYEKKLADLDENYKLISTSFKTDTNNILVIEDLIENLKTRLQLLKDIQQHIKLLNQKNENYETSI
ncbi:hypothetical protein [uncultured Lacinutrix sp.]|uniref:hypothetical protein n=1 Tax=uncultured Lacinutrix sp. TaxID=574032 RepID=UPI002612106D|nr:hypothetical protein [uncultured Lacinutrix sp.]